MFGRFSRVMQIESRFAHGFGARDRAALAEVREHARGALEHGAAPRHAELPGRALERGPERVAGEQAVEDSGGERRELEVTNLVFGAAVDEERDRRALRNAAVVWIRAQAMNGVAVAYDAGSRRKNQTAVRVELECGARGSRFGERADDDVEGFVAREIERPRRQPRIVLGVGFQEIQKLARHVSEVVGARPALDQEALEVFVEEPPQTRACSRNGELDGIAQPLANERAIHGESPDFAPERVGVPRRNTVSRE